MCFSPEASFAGGIIILSIGVITITKVHKRSQIVFASIPLFFGIQQIVEGLLWLTLLHPDHNQIQKAATYTFMVMAEVLWPMIIPLTVLFMEENPKRKKVLWTLLFVGMALSLYYSYCLVCYSVTPRINGFHIKYYNNFPKSLAMVAFTLYVIVTITPLFISSIKRTHIMGTIMFLSCLVTGIFYTQYLTSVWCFFAAMMSCVIFWILRDARRKFRLGKISI